MLLCVFRGMLYLDDGHTPRVVGFPPLTILLFMLYWLASFSPLGRILLMPNFDVCRPPYSYLCLSSCSKLLLNRLFVRDREILMAWSCFACTGSYVMCCFSVKRNVHFLFM
ncbi:unnamed protein product [Pylaiella littoralis]